VVLCEFSVALCVIKHIITLSYTEGAQSGTEKFLTLDLHDYIIETKYYCIIKFEQLKNKNTDFAVSILSSAPIRFIREIRVLFLSTTFYLPNHLK